MARGWLIWGKVAEATEGRIGVEVCSVPTHEGMDRCLQAGNIPVVKFFLPSGAPHWGVVVGKSGQDYLVLLRKIYAANPGMPHRSEFEQLDGRYRAIEKLSLTEGDADAEACAAAQGFLEGVEDQVARLYWLARLEQLDREY